MNASFEEARKIAGEFSAEFSLLERSEYVNGLGITEVRLHDPNCPESEKNDHCLVVLLAQLPPADFIVPDRYKNLRVFTEVGGEIILGH